MKNLTYIQSIQNKIEEHAREQQDIGEHYDFCDPQEQKRMLKRSAELDKEITKLQDYVDMLEAEYKLPRNNTYRINVDVANVPVAAKLKRTEQIVECDVHTAADGNHYINFPTIPDVTRIMVAELEVLAFEGVQKRVIKQRMSGGVVDMITDIILLEDIQMIYRKIQEIIFREKKECQNI